MMRAEWDGLGEEPMTDAEWRAYLRSQTRDELEGLLMFGAARQRADIEDEIDRRDAEGE